MADSDILTAAFLELPCSACGRHFAVTLRQVLLSQEVLRHEGCAAPDRATECPPAAFRDLIECSLLDELERVWDQLRNQAHASGGRLLVGA
jgi:hypothetical protein